MINPIKRALLSVSNKSGLVDFARELVAMGIEVLSTGGTSQLLRENGVDHLPVEAVTGLPEMLDGRVKTLHPRIHGGILGKRDQHAAQAVQHDLSWIDLVVVNFYPFREATTKQSLSLEQAVEYIDIGGPTMVRAAAKNMAWVTVVTDPADYTAVIESIRRAGGVDPLMRQALVAKAFALTADYDATIADYFNKLSSTNAANPNLFPNQLNLVLNKVTDLRYGENPHQQAAAYQLAMDAEGILQAHQYQGKPLSYNNMLDAEAAFQAVSEWTAPACVIVKHANPCGAATAATIEEAYLAAYQADPLSAFGGIVALNRPCTASLAQAMTSIFLEVILAPAFTEEALAILAAKPNLRLLTLPAAKAVKKVDMRFVSGGVLIQERDQGMPMPAQLSIVTKRTPSATEQQALLFAWQMVKHIKSNAILIARETSTLGIGVGQVSRIDAVECAIRKASGDLTGAVLASDAFFPFRDSIDRIAQTGIRAIIQPGGAMRDAEVIAACDEQAIAMIFTGRRCFRH